jgi:hypothetical protein
LIRRLEQEWNVQKLREEEQAKTAAELAAWLNVVRDEKIGEQVSQEAKAIAARKAGGIRPVSSSAKVHRTNSLPDVREPTDPRYIAIREQEKAKWTNSGRSFSSRYDWRILVENAILKFRQQYPDAWR